MNNAGMWGNYVNALMAERDMTETAFADAVGVQQGTLNRWRHGKNVPDKAAYVAGLARSLGHNPLEAFVAAGMLVEDEAGRGLTANDRAFLASVKGVAVESEAGVSSIDVQDVEAELAIRQPKRARARGREPR